MEFIDYSKIKTGDVLLVSSKSWLARAIQSFQKIVNGEGGKYNHAAVFWWCYDELFITEAIKSGVTITPFKDYIESKSNLLLLKPNFRVDGSECGKFMLPYCGRTRYGFWNLIVAQAIYIITFGKIWLGPKKGEHKRFICGQWAAFVSNFNYKMHTGKVLFEDPAKIAPVRLYMSEGFTHYNIVR